MERKTECVEREMEIVEKFRISAVTIAALTVLAAYFLLMPTAAKPKSEQPAATAEAYCSAMQNDLERAIGALRGVKSCQVVICFESTPEIVVAYISSTSANGSVTSSPQILTQQGQQLPLVLKTIYPKALGVIVVADGAQNTAVKLDIIHAVTTLLQIEPSRVNVFAMQA